MKLRVEQLESHLRQGLAPIYLLSGEEPLQLAEAADLVRRAAQAQGYTERELMHAEAGFDWQGLLAAAGSLSLFAERRLLDLRLPSGKPGEAGAKALQALAAQPPPDTILLITSGKLDAQQQRSKWFTTLEQAGVSVQIWPVARAALPAWIERRMQRRGLRPSREAVVLLAERVEGNLLAADQEIEKLLLLHGPGTLEADQVAAAVADSARYDVYTLVDAALGGDAARVAHVLYGLREEGVEPVLVLWALARELRSLSAMAHEVAGGAKPEQVVSRHGVWEKRKALVTNGLRRHGLRAWQQLLGQAAGVDRVCKGAAPGNAWDELLQLSVAMTGTRLFSHGARQGGRQR